jgi:hypothetical protein
MSRVLYLVSGRRSAIWRELAETVFADVDAVFVDRDGKIVRQDGSYLGPLAELDGLVSGRDVCFLHFSAATPNNSAGMAWGHFERANYSVPKQVIDLLVSSSAAQIYHLNFSTTAMFDRTSSEPLLTLASRRVSDADPYGLTKLMYWSYIESLAERTNRVLALTLVCPVLLGRYVQGNFLASVIRDVRAKITPTVANLDDDFNAVFPVRFVPLVVAALMRKSANPGGHVTLLGGATRKTTVRALLRVLNAPNFRVAAAKFPPKLIDVTSFISYVGSADIDAEQELAFYTQGST